VWILSFTQLSGHKNTNEYDAPVKMFLECLNNCIFHQNVIEPRFQNNIGKDVLYLIITENKNRVYKLVHLPPLGGINHGHHIIKFNYSHAKCLDNIAFMKEKFSYKIGKFDDLRQS
jgi:hypothetical protein